jgi:hypothetical protein
VIPSTCTRAATALQPLLPPASNLLRLCRLGLILSILILLLIFLNRRFSLLSRFAHEESSSTNLAVARIATMLTLLTQVHYSFIQRIAGLDHALLIPFGVWGKAAARMPLSHHAVAVVYFAFLATTVCALLGIFTRTACALTGLSSLYLLCIPQLSGKVDHDIGHLVIFSFILALSPSADALSIHAARLGRRINDPLLWIRPRRARVYATALQAMMLYIAIAYFFPGLWKLVAYGTHWFQPAHMHILIATMWDGIGLTPIQAWYLSHPVLQVLGAVTTIVFELGFVFAILSPRTRWMVIPPGLIFHNLTLLVMGIAFAGLQCLYVIFFDWTPLAAQLTAHLASHKTPTLPAVSGNPLHASLALRAVCLIALTGIVLTGALRKMLTWPINCYPTFDWPISNNYEVRTLRALDIQGMPHTWTLSADPTMRRAFGNERWKAMVWNDFGNPAESPAQNRAAITLWLKYHPAPALTSAVITDTIVQRPALLEPPTPLSACTLKTLTAADLP